MALALICSPLLHPCSLSNPWTNQYKPRTHPSRTCFPTALSPSHACALKHAISRSNPALPPHIPCLPQGQALHYSPSHGSAWPRGNADPSRPTLLSSLSCPIEGRVPNVCTYCS